jgi:ATP-binding cassette, subfamily B, bacterial
MLKNRFPTYNQLYAKDCAPACLKIIAKYYHKDIGIDYLRELCETTRIGTNLENLSHAAEKVGFRTLGVKISLDQIDVAPLPCVLHWGKEHFIVLYKIQKDKYFVSDPSVGLVSYTKKQFLDNWIGKQVAANTKEGIALLIEITPRFNPENIQNEDPKLPFSFFLAYLKNHKSFVRQLLIGLFLSSIVQLLFPFLTQSIIDVGIVNQDIDFIYLILFAQLFLYIGKLSIGILRDWILLHIGTRVKVLMISDFIIKLMGLPISFYDSKLTGDILQRMEDHERIRVLLTSSSLNLVFSTFNLFVFGIILALYNTSIFFVFLGGTICYFLWFALFLKKRAQVDTTLFQESIKDNYKVIELINGMQEIKLNNAERRKRWTWETIQVKLYNLDLKSLSISQYQTHGTDFINEIKNLIITIMAANLVIDGTITLGMLLAIMYILGQLNLPLRLLLQFIKELQDANLAYHRLSEITMKQKEEEPHKIHINDVKDISNIYIRDLNFSYPGTDKLCLKNISFNIPKHKVTALVGKSGSGKTTLLKLLLKFYQPTSGTIEIGNVNLKKVSNHFWRNYCGVVMQEGFIFDDTLRNNICLSDSLFDKDRFTTAIEIANLTQLIDELPIGYNTPIGNKGIGLSSGEKQRILIARAIYKNPELLFFDEATSALDTENEKIIVNNLDRYYASKTSLIIAHRLSTVKNADEIIVLDKGEIVEKGTHSKLIEKKGFYFNLVKNQLELGI